MKFSVLYADETGGRVDGKHRWKWCFGNPESTFYMIDRSRGSPALVNFCTATSSGTLVTDLTLGAATQ